MKKKILITTLFAVAMIGSFTLGKTQAKIVEIVPNNYIDTTSDDFFNNYIDMRTVSDFEASDNGLLLYTNDGNGYYWGRSN